jgi:quinohemoprotein ethanol dehydrogenase
MRTLGITFLTLAALIGNHAAGQTLVKPTSLVSDGELRKGHKGQWLTHGLDYAETRFSPLDNVTDANVSHLGMAWSFDMETRRGLEATPLVADDMMFVTSAWSVVYALDAKTGTLIWKFDPQVDPSYGQRACCDVVNRGVAIYRGKVFVGTLDGWLVALDAASGKRVWQQLTVDHKRGYTITGAPRVVKGKVLIGNGGAEFGVRGYISAYDAETGNPVWRVYTVPGDPSLPVESPALERALKTWTGRWWEAGGGGTPWDTMAFDPALDLLYVGTGNGSPWMQSLRSPGGGDNLYLSSILALRPDTGQMVWYYQTTPGDSWDYTATQHIILADITIGGSVRKVLMQAPKNGFFYVLDRATGELLSAKAYADISWATGVDMKTGRPIEAPGVRSQSPLLPMMQKPGPLGAHNWQPMSYNPKTGLVYIPARMDGFPYMKDPQWKFSLTPGVWNNGQIASPTNDPLPPGTGELLAWDPVAQSARWRVPLAADWNGGTLSTAGNLVFQGTGDGRFVAYNADRGEKLWEVVTGAGVIGSPMTYSISGHQYVAVLAGWGGAASLFGENRTGRYGVPGRLLVFTLDGKQAVPAVAQKPRPTPAALPYNTESAYLQKGSALYGGHCVMCHGIAAISGGSINDLRYSAEGVLKSYPKIVLEGSYQGMGMPSFSNRLKEADVEAIRNYILDRRAAIGKADKAK